jgi:hypothetical protein
MVAESADIGPACNEPEFRAATLEARVLDLGLRLRGGFVLDPQADRHLVARFPQARSAVLIGNVGDELWRRSGLAIRAQGGQHPLNDWIRAALTPISRDFALGIVFDFDGPPYYPFQQWAQRAEPVFPSPLGLLIHPVFGLWHAYRALLVFGNEYSPSTRASGASPCATCLEKPCLNSCPVKAFDTQGYNVQRCRDHLLADGLECRASGCLARLSCPIGAPYRYRSDQMVFHMDAFVASLRRRGAIR